MSETAPISSRKTEMIDALGLELDELAELEDVQQKSGEAWQEAMGYLEESRRYEHGGCFGPVHLVYEDPELAKAERAAGNEMHEAAEKVFDKKLELTETLIKDEEIPGFKRFAAVQSLFMAAPENRAQYATDFNNALEHLDGALFRGELIYAAESVEGEGFYVIHEPGIKIELNTHAGGRVPYVAVSTKEASGTFLPARGRGTAKPHAPKQIALYGWDSRIMGAQPIEALTPKSFSGVGEDAESMRGPRFMVGEAATNVLNSDHTASGSRALELALALRRLNFPADVSERFSDESLSILREQIVKSMARQVMGATVADPEKDIVFSDGFRGFAKQELKIDLSNAKPKTFRLVAEVMGVLETEEIRPALEGQIDQLEEAILTGQAPASRYPEVQVGRLRLDAYVNELEAA